MNNTRKESLLLCACEFCATQAGILCVCLTSIDRLFGMFLVLFELARVPHVIQPGGCCGIKFPSKLEEFWSQSELFVR
jgi:hypothetical protein